MNESDRETRNSIKPEYKPPLFSTCGAFGLLPYIFTMYRQEGTSEDIFDPQANIVATMNYIEDRYGGPDYHRHREYKKEKEGPR